ncbi:MAG TPA: hypothetical protein ENJ51_12690 [Leucothrix mucor]|uniref:Uncharacterized protein n=1 Tax=Leucothrix mucor TaxID=45248 RepID=A0A7V2T5D1_LEUMU|nr:hypothetical protein [Leucothrix mucor]
MKIQSISTEPRKDEKSTKRIILHEVHEGIGYQLKAGQVTSWQITRTLRQAQGTSLSKGAGE